MKISAELLQAVMPNSKGAASWVAPLEESRKAFGITTPQRLMMWLASIAHESAELTRLEENLRYTSPARLRTVFPRHFVSDEEAGRYILLGEEAIGSRVYADRMGNGDEKSNEGWIYRARGPIGVTGKNNYRACSLVLCGDADTLLKNPEFLVDPEFGAASAGWYWDMADCTFYADQNDFDGVCDAINIGRKTIALGDSNGFADRLHYLGLCRQALL